MGSPASGAILNRAASGATFNTASNSVSTQRLAPYGKIAAQEKNRPWRRVATTSAASDSTQRSARVRSSRAAMAARSSGLIIEVVVEAPPAAPLVFDPP